MGLNTPLIKRDGSSGDMLWSSEQGVLPWTDALQPVCCVSLQNEEHTACGSIIPLPQFPLSIRLFVRLLLNLGLS